MAIILIIKTEDGEITELPLLSKIVLGRSSSSDYIVKDSKISGSHCSFEITPRDQVMFIDLGSTNGSYCNNSKTTQTLVKINDVIRIGNTLIRIEEKRLTIGERRAIGLSANRQVDEKTLPTEDHSDKTKIEILDKNMKKRSAPSVTFSKVDNVLEQELSTGATKLLKLDSKKKKKN